MLAAVGQLLDFLGDFEARKTVFAELLRVEFQGGKLLGDGRLRVEVRNIKHHLGFSIITCVLLIFYILDFQNILVVLNELVNVDAVLGLGV